MEREAASEPGYSLRVPWCSGYRALVWLVVFVRDSGFLSDMFKISAAPLTEWPAWQLASDTQSL